MPAVEHLNPQQFLSMRSAVAKSNNFVHVRKTPFDAGVDTGVDTSFEHHMQLGADEKVHTRQEGFFKPAVRRYVDHPNNPDNFREDEGQDLPQVYQHGDRMWMGEGHHRLLASRLRGDFSTTVAFRDLDAERGP